MNTRKKFHLSRWQKVALLTITILTIAILIVRLAGSYWLKRYVPQLETAITSSTGLVAKIRGKSGISFYPALGIRLGDVELKQENGPKIGARELVVGLKLLALLDKEIAISNIVIYQPDIQWPLGAGLPIPPARIVDSSTGSKDKPGYQLSSLGLIRVHQGKLVVTSPIGEPVYAIEGGDLEIHPLGSSAPLAKSVEELKLAMYLSFEKARIRKVELGPSRIKGRFQNGKLIVSITQSQVLDGAGIAGLVWQKNAQGQHLIEGSFSLIGFDSRKSAAWFGRKAFVSGKLDLGATFTVNTDNLKDIKKSISGNLHLSGKDIDLISINLDELLRKIIESQNYDLVDATAFFFVGPLGTAATKGYDFSNIAVEATKSKTAANKILKMVSIWDVSNGIATTRDVALETAKYRLAMNGRINVIKNEFDDLRVAIIDNKGCAIAKQRLNGPINNPSIDKLNILLTLTQPVLDVLGKSAKQLLSAATECTPFYTGSLLPESKKNSKTESDSSTE